MPKRMLDDSFLSSPSIAACSPRAQDAFPRFILLADDFGCLDINPRVLLGRGWPLRADVTEAEIAGWLEEYRGAGMLQVWVAEGRTYGHLRGWDGRHGQHKRQEYDPVKCQHGSKRRTPPPPDDNQAELLPARETGGKPQPPADFPPTQSQSYTQSQSHQHLAGAVAPAGTETAGRAETSEPGQPPRPAEISRLATVQAPSRGDLELSSESPKRPRKAPKADKPPDPRIRELSDRLVATYKRVTGMDYTFQGPKDGGALPKLCAALSERVTIDELARRFEAGLRARFGTVTGIADFASRPNDPRWGGSSTRAEDQHHNSTPGVYHG